MNTPATRQTSESIDFNASQVGQSLLETTLRNGAQQMLQQAIEAEVGNYLRLTSDRPCLLVLVGARADGSKELVAVGDGQRESKL
ncbi:MAG: hypothetical protein CMO80_21115, partial [Verrucomicrobiales bacterium]|nr:hypothetical protein [Verrucomicrobiales bacterium]